MEIPYSRQVHKKEVSKNEGDTCRDEECFDERNQESPFLRKETFFESKFKNEDEEEDEEARGQSIGYSSQHKNSINHTQNESDQELPGGFIDNEILYNLGA
jgi:hypothetical protein